MKRIEKIRETIEMMDSLVAYPHGMEHCILPETYDELANNLIKLFGDWCPLPDVEEPKIELTSCAYKWKFVADFQGGKVYQCEICDEGTWVK